jgi:HTH-type transcriptional regulator, glycine betaine synthesis regulator
MLRKETDALHAARRADDLVIDAAGKLFDQWGYRSTMGRTWALLYLSPAPLDAEDIRKALGFSVGSCSMVLRDLMKLGLAHREAVPGRRKFHYRAETELWTVITRIFKERERARFASLVGQIKEAEGILAAFGADGNPDARMSYRLGQVHHLVTVGTFVIDLADAFMDRTRTELKAAQKLLSVSGRFGGEAVGRLRRALGAGRTGRPVK